MAVAPLVTSRMVEPLSEAVSTRINSGLVSNRGTLAGAPTGNGSGSCTPGSRKGRATPGKVPKKMPLEVDVAAASFTLPSVGPTTFSTSMCTRMPSYFSSWLMGPAGFVSATVSVTGVGKGLPLLISEIEGDPEISVDGGLLGSLLGMNSLTVPVT